jgi:DNA-binding transcriptional ArsR family regulator
MKATSAAPVFAALGDETRLAIVARLCRSGPQSIVELTEDSKVTRQAVSKHLVLLEQAGLVRSARDGREKLWSVRTSKLEEAQRWLDQISRDWDSAIERLRILVEADHGLGHSMRSGPAGLTSSARSRTVVAARPRRGDG